MNARSRRFILMNCSMLFVTLFVGIALLPGSASANKNLTVSITGSGSVICGANSTTSSATWSYANTATVVCDLAPAAGYNLTTPATSPQTILMSNSNQSLAVTFTLIPPVTKTLAVNITGTGTVACQDINGGAVTTRTTSGSITYNSTQTVACTLTPGTDFALTSPASPATRTMSSNQTLDVIFSSTLITNVTVSGTVAPSGGGSIRADSAAGPVIVAQGSASGSYATITANTAHTYYLIPAAGYGIKQLVYDSVNVTSALSCPSGIDATCTYAAPSVGTTNHTIAATYDSVYTVTASASTSGCGAVAGGGTISPASQKVARGTTATFYVTPNTGYALKQVNYDGSTDLATAQYSPYTYSKANILANGAVEAIFTPVYTITASWSGIGGATGGISPPSAAVICGGASPPFIITPTVPAVITNVLAGGVSQGVVNNYTFTNVSANSTLQVIFEISTSLSDNYTITPPFIHTNILPNLLLMLDNSASMYDLAHDPYGKCYDDAYNNAVGADYAGYFVSDSVYSYSSGKFIPGATLPASCTFRTSDFCVDMTAGAKGVRTVSQFIAKGKFLNWLSASKLDLQKKILTGGKYDTGNLVLVGESRGCMGRRFVKMVSNTQASGSTDPDGLSALTFAVRGPVSAEADYVNPASQGGTTRIEIYDGTYNLGACTTAIQEWTDLAQMGQAQTATQACLACPTCDVTRTLQMKTYLFMTHVCWHSLNGSTIPGGQLGQLTDACNAVYLLPQYNAGIPPSSLIVNDAAGDSVCSSVIQHPIMTSGGNDVGYLGLCWNGSVWDNACLLREINDFCGQMNMSSVTDPSGTIAGTTDSNTVPAFVIDAGVNALGKVTGTYFVNVSRDTSDPPEGLINEFKNYINFGAMRFNSDGSGSECVDSDTTGTKIVCARHCSNNVTKACYRDTDCSPGSCDLNAKTDGGKMLDSGYIGFNPVGDHASGLIKGIDDITAGSWTPFAEAFYDAIGYFANRTVIRLQNSDFDVAKPPPTETCLLNNVLLISDGGSTADRNGAVSTLAGYYNDGTANSHGTCPNSDGSKDLVAMAWLAKNRNIKNFSLSGGSTELPANNSDSITTYAVYNGPSTASTDPCVSQNIMKNAAIAGGTTYYHANNYQTLSDSLRETFQRVAKSSASGTAASILSNSEGSGAVILQAVFYPKKDFLTSTVPVTRTSTTWIGEMQNLWYYVDPFIGNSSVREDTGYISGDHVMNLTSDNVTQFFFDATANETKAVLKKDTDGNGSGETVVTSADDPRVDVDAPGVVSADDVSSLWRAGRLLWKRTSSRKLYTYLKGTTVKRSDNTDTGAFSVDGLIDLVADFDGLSSTDKEILTLLLQAADAADAKNIIRYAAGDDTVAINGVTNRNRTVTISEKDPATGVVTTSTNVWKLGDIISSTPRVQSGSKLNSYHLAPVMGGYGDLTYANDSAASGFANSDNYKDRGMVYAGANDGMLHAFKLGKLEVSSVGATKARLTGSNLGDEQWSFIPRQVLPYLKYLADTSYNHFYLVDGTTRIVDASIGYNNSSPAAYTGCTADAYWNCKKDAAKTANKSWRTVLIGSMGIGGASRNKGNTCIDKASVGTCVKTPIDGIGYSSYFALDITDPALPTFLWDFSDESMGYSTTGAAAVRIANKITTAGVDYKDTNGRWYAVIGNGPSGPINTTSHEFGGKSDKKLKVFVLDLKYGPKTGYKFEHESTLDNAFAGSLADASVDTDRWNRLSDGFYSDDALYFGYSQCTASCDTATPSWDGGVMRFLTQENMDPAQWELTTLLSNTGPVTASIGRLQDRKNHKLWLYFGVGRYFFKEDDKSLGRTLIGVKEPCYKANDDLTAPAGDTCRVAINFSSGTGFVNQSGTVANTVGDNGWFITMAGEDIDNKNYAERSITDPVAMTNGAVFFTTYKPSADVCKFGGNSYIWGVKYDTGGVALSSSLKGKALVQVSTGSFEEIDLSTALTAEGGRKMGTPMVGKPPNDPPPIVSSSGNKPLKRVIHIQEK